MKELPCTDPRVDSGLTQKIEGEFGLWEKEVPNVGWKIRIDFNQNCQEVVLDGANGVLCLIAAMHVRGMSWKVAFYLKVMASLYAKLASLSRIWRSTERPRAARRVMIKL